MKSKPSTILEQKLGDKIEDNDDKEERKELYDINYITFDKTNKDISNLIIEK